MSDLFSSVRDKILHTALPHVPFDGWSDRLLQQAVKQTGIDPGVALLAFPDGPMDLLGHFWAAKDAALGRAIAAGAPFDPHLSARITGALRLYIDLLQPDREGVRRALALQALPQNLPFALRCLYRTVDSIWFAVGDSSTDFNFYTKRAILAAVVASTVTHWLGESGAATEDIGGFIDRRVGDILRFEQTKSRARNFAHTLPSPARILGRLFGNAD